MIKKELYPPLDLLDIKDLLEKSVNKYGDLKAFEFKKANLPNVHTNADIKEDGDFGSISYRQFKYDIDCLGSKLCSLGLKDKRIAVISDNRYEWCVSYMSIVAGTGIVVPLDRSLPENEIESSLIRSEVEAVLFENKYLELMKKIQKEGKTKIKYFINFDNEKLEDNIHSFKDFLEDGKEIVKTGYIDFLNAEIDRENMGIMLFTSGTTSMSKIVMLSHKNIVSNVISVLRVIRVYDTDKLLSFLPLHHTLESTVWLVAVTNGACVAFCEGIKYIQPNLSDYKISVMVCVPLLFENMHKKVIAKMKATGKLGKVRMIGKVSDFLLHLGIDLRKKIFKQIHDNLGGNIRLFVSGAAAIDKQVAKDFNTFGLEMIQGYGLTETSPVLALESDKYRKVGSVGLSLPNVEIKIDSPDENGIGEIVAKGPNIMIGYYGNEEATKEVLEEGWFKTGDLGYLDKNGYLTITGRKKNVIVLKNGKNIFPEEIEAIINKNEYVGESMVYGKPDRDDDLKLCVKIVYNEEIVERDFGKDVDEEKLKENLWEFIKTINKTMPPYKYIRELIVTKEPFIKTTTQKIKRHEEIKKILG